MTALAAKAPQFPEALENDNDDVAWALQTAAVQWNRGGQADALVWLRRAVDAAIDIGAHERAQQLNRMTEELESFLASGGVLGPVGPQSGGTPASGDDVDALLSGSADLPSVELGHYEFATQSLVDAVELASRDENPFLAQGGGQNPFTAAGRDDDAFDSIDVPVDVPVDDAPVEELDAEDIDEIELLDEDEVEEVAASREVPVVPAPGPLPKPQPPRSSPSARPSQPARPSQSPRPSQLPRPSQAARPSQPARTPQPPKSPPAPRPLAPPPARVRAPATPPPQPAPFPAPLRSPPPPPAVEPEEERASEPGAMAYRESAERNDETTHRRSLPADVVTSAPSETHLEKPLPSSPAASQPYTEDYDGPTGVLRMPIAPHAEEQTTGFEQPQDEPTIVEPLPPVDEEEAPPSSLPEIADLAPPSSMHRVVTQSEEPEIAPPSVAPESVAPEAAAEDDTEEAPTVVEDELDVDRESIPAAAASEPAQDGEPALGGVVLAEVRGLEDLPPETQAELVAKARIEKLGPEEEVSAFGLALVLKGRVAVMPAIADVACAHAGEREPVFCKGNLEDGVEMRVVAMADGAEVAVWRADDFEGAMQSCPWVADELRIVADRFQALAGATMGPIGDGLDDTMRAMVTDRAEIKRLEPGELLVEKGKPLPGLHIVGAGRLENEAGGELLPGDLLFAQQILGGGATPATVRAGEQGALVLFIDRMATHELMMSVPPWLELLATS